MPLSRLHPLVPSFHPCFISKSFTELQMWYYPRKRDPEGRLQESWPVLIQGKGGWRAGLDLPHWGRYAKTVALAPQVWTELTLSCEEAHSLHTHLCPHNTQSVTDACLLKAQTATCMFAHTHVHVQDRGADADSFSTHTPRVYTNLTPYMLLQE